MSVEFSLKLQLALSLSLSLFVEAQTWTEKKTSLNFLIKSNNLLIKWKPLKISYVICFFLDVEILLRIVHHLLALSGTVFWVDINGGPSCERNNWQFRSSMPVRTVTNQNPKFKIIVFGSCFRPLFVRTSQREKKNLEIFTRKIVNNDEKSETGGGDLGWRGSEGMEGCTVRRFISSFVKSKHKDFNLF